MNSEIKFNNKKKENIKKLKNKVFFLSLNTFGISHFGNCQLILINLYKLN